MNRQDTVLSMPFAKLYALLVQKAMKKGRTREEADTVTCWLTGYTSEELKRLKNPIYPMAIFSGRPPA